MHDLNQLKETVIKAGNVPPLKDYLWELWQYKMLLWVFTARDIKVRYAQTILGFAWIVLSPIITVGVFTFVFGMMIKVPSDGLPYILFYLVAIIPWYAFIAIMNLTLGSVDGNAGLVTKIYFPRLLLGGSYTLSSGVDYLVGFGIILLCSCFYHHFTLQLLVLFPFLFLMQALFAMGLGLFLAPFASRYRDIKLVIPLALQFYYFANPILYPISAAPPWLRIWYELNPMSVVICTFRDALNGQWPDLWYFSVAILSCVTVFILGFQCFRKREQTIVDAL